MEYKKRNLKLYSEICKARLEKESNTQTSATGTKYPNSVGLRSVPAAVTATWREWKKVVCQYWLSGMTRAGTVERARESS